MLLAVFSCAPAPKEEKVSASFSAPVPTRFTLVNASDSTINVSFWPEYALADFGAHTPDSLAAGDSTTVTLELHQPGFVVTSMAYRRNYYDLLPGYHRTLVYEAAANITQGPHTGTYQALDRTKEWLPWTIGAELTGLLYEDFLEHMGELGARALDSLYVFKEEHPELSADLANRMEAEIRLRALKNMTGYTNYRRFFYGEEHPLPRWLTDTVDAALAAYTYGEVPDYGELLKSLTIVRQNARMDVAQEKQSAATRNYTALMHAYLELPDDPTGYTARGDLAMEIIGKDRDFTNRQMIMDTLLNAVPEDFRRRVLAYGEAFAASRDASGLQTLFTSRLREEHGDSVQVAEQRDSRLTLYKFWFAGCYPCIVQYPHERDLLTQYPELQMHTIAFETESEAWSAYLRNRRPPGGRHFFVAPEQSKLVEDALGGLGAPQYVLVGEGEVICRSCPKPSDPLLAEKIEGALGMVE